MFVLSFTNKNTQIFGYRQIRLLLLLSLPAATFGRCPRAPRAHHVLDVGTDVRVELREETEATGQWSGNKARCQGWRQQFGAMEICKMVNQADIASVSQQQNSFDLRIQGFFSHSAQVTDY